MKTKTDQRVLRPEVRLAIVTSALGGQVLSQWWGADWEAGRAHALSVGGGWYSATWSGERKADGVHVWFGRRYDGQPASVHDHDFQSRIREPDVIMPWTDIRDVVRKGATPDLQKRYEDTYRAYVTHACLPLPTQWIPHSEAVERGLPKGWFQKDSANLEHWATGSRIGAELSDAGLAILTAGCENSPQMEQMGLW